jgi:FkbM family methyltransferase
LCYGGEPNYLEKLGTDYGSWVIPNSISLSSDSVVYSAGVGEDISFDLLLQSKYNCNITLIDPTSRAKNHFDEVSSFYNTNDWKFSGDVQSDYKLVIENLKPNLDKFQFLQVGLWKCKDRLRFYKHDNPLYVSQTLIPDMFGKNYDEVSVNSVKNIMQENGHTKIDLLKIDVEGAEIDVINQMINDKIYPKYICVEMDLYSKGKDQDNLTSTLLENLINNHDYIMIFSDEEFNITLERRV